MLGAVLQLMLTVENPSGEKQEVALREYSLGEEAAEEYFAPTISIAANAKSPANFFIPISPYDR